jgi:hypothetical protein
MSWKVEVVTDDSGEWESDCLRFASDQEALAYARRLEFRCSAVRDKRIVKCEDANRLGGENPSPARQDDNSAEYRKRLLSKLRAAVEQHGRTVDYGE